MPMSQKRRRRRHRQRELPPPPHEGVSRRRLGEDGASLPGSLVDLDSSSTTSCSPPTEVLDESVMSLSEEPRYFQIIASRLAQLKLPVGHDGLDLADPPNLPSSEILEALTRKSLDDDYSRVALVEYQCQNSLIEVGRPDIQGLDTEDSGEPEPGELIQDEDYTRLREELASRITEIDTYTELDQEETNKLHLKRALYLIKAALLLKGKPIDELDAAALERKYHPELIVENECFFHYVNAGYFGFYFDSKLCYKAYLTDYQRLVLINEGDLVYTSWKKYRALYSTPEADRDYLRYWERLVKKIKWLKKYALTNESTYEWAQIHSKASIQAVRLAAEFPHMTMELAGVGLSEFRWNASTYLLFVEDCDGMFYEIWKRVNADHQLGFRDALKQVYDAKLYPAQHRTMKYELEFGGTKTELLFRQCTGGLCKDVPECRARELIKQEIHWRGGMPGTYAQYARKKLKIAELIGLISSDNVASA